MRTIAPMLLNGTIQIQNMRWNTVIWLSVAGQNQSPPQQRVLPHTLRQRCNKPAAAKRPLPSSILLSYAKFESVLLTGLVLSPSFHCVVARATGNGP